MALTIGERLRDARKAMKMTQEDLAKKIGVKRAVISKYETGLISPSADTLQKNCKRAKRFDGRFANHRSPYPVGDTG